MLATAGLNQAQLARRAKTKQPAIARAENHGCTPVLAERFLKAMGFDLKFHHVSFGNSEFRDTFFLG